MSSLSSLRRADWPLLLLAFSLLIHWSKLMSPGMGLLPNLSPWLGLCFAGSLMLRRPMPWWVAPSLLMLTERLALGASQAFSSEGLLMLCFYAICSLAGRALRGRLALSQGVAATALLSLAYYVLSNTVAWMGTPGYGQDLAGWWQAQTVGLPGFPPSWIFLRNALLGDIGLAALLALAAQPADLGLRQRGVAAPR